MTDPAIPPPAPVPIDQLVPGVVVRDWTEDGEQLRARAAVDPSTGWPSQFVYRYRIQRQVVRAETLGMSWEQLALLASLGGDLDDNGARIVRMLDGLGLVEVEREVPA